MEQLPDIFTGCIGGLLIEAMLKAYGCYSEHLELFRLGPSPWPTLGQRRVCHIGREAGPLSLSDRAMIAVSSAVTDCLQA